MPENTKKKEEQSALELFNKVLEKIEPVKLTETATVVTKTGRKYTYDFAPLPDVERAVRKATAGSPFTILQSVEPTDRGTHHVITQVIDMRTGEVVNSAVYETAPNLSPQELGSSTSYFRRYGLGVCFRIVTESDDDGASATASHGESVKPQPKKRQSRASDAPKLSAGVHVSEVTGCKLVKETDKWKLWIITTPKGEVATFDDTTAGTCMSAAKMHRVVEITVEERKGKTAATKAVLTDIDQPQQDDESWIPPDDEENF